MADVRDDPMVSSRSVVLLYLIRSRSEVGNLSRARSSLLIRAGPGSIVLKWSTSMLSGEEADEGE